MNEQPADSALQKVQKSAQVSAKKEQAIKKPIDKTNPKQTRGELDQEFRDHPDIYKTSYDKLVRLREWLEVGRQYNLLEQQVEAAREAVKKAQKQAQSKQKK